MINKLTLCLDSSTTADHETYNSPSKSTKNLEYLISYPLNQSSHPPGTPERGTSRSGRYYKTPYRIYKVTLHDTQLDYH